MKNSTTYALELVERLNGQVAYQLSDHPLLGYFGGWYDTQDEALEGWIKSYLT